MPAAADLLELRAFDPELFLLESGLRALAKKEDVSAARGLEIEAWGRARGLRTRSIPAGGPDPRARGLGGGQARLTVFLGRDAAAMDAAEEWTSVEQARDDPRRRDAVRAMGRLLGYPDCCAAAFAAQAVGDDAATLARLLDAAPAGGLLDPLCNFLVPCSLVLHAPCGWECLATRAGARRALADLGRAAPALAATVREVIGLPLLVRDRFRVAAILGERLPDGGVAVRSCHTFLDLTGDESVQSSEALRDFAAWTRGLPPRLPAAGLPAARLLCFGEVAS